MSTRRGVLHQVLHLLHVPQGGAPRRAVSLPMQVAHQIQSKIRRHFVRQSELSVVEQQLEPVQRGYLVVVVAVQHAHQQPHVVFVVQHPIRS